MYQSVGFASPFGKDVYLSDLHYENNSTNYSLGQYKIKAGSSKKSVDDTFKDLQEFIKFINGSSTGTTTEIEWETKLNVHGFIRA